MSATLDLTGVNKIVGKLATLSQLNATDLMRSWMTLIEEDNRTGILAGTDKDGVPMVPVTYRPRPAPGFRVTKPGKANAATAKRFRLGQGAGRKKGMFAGLGSVHQTLMHNNLTSSEYRLLAGPPLAPRDQFSRVITNLKTRFQTPTQGGQWAAIGAWEEVVNPKGLPFLFYHFNGIGQKRRDLRGVRPGGMVKAVDALRNWARLAIREHFEH